MSDGLLTIVPSRGRPESVLRVVAAWDATGAFADGGSLVFAIDEDDPRHPEYLLAIGSVGAERGVSSVSVPEHIPMTHKLNKMAFPLAVGQFAPFAIGFAGDDHLPRTKGWVSKYLRMLRVMGTGIVYGNDGFQCGRLCTEWAMTADIVRLLGRMVPADVEHMYSDDSVMQLGMAAQCIAYLPTVIIEHMHPLAGKGSADETYELTNNHAQYVKDRAQYLTWIRDKKDADVAALLELCATEVQRGE
jgi:hypothetical protein